MSERGTFVTSFLYDRDRISPVLKETLPAICRKDCLVECVPDPDTGLARFYSGLMHGGYGGEEAMQMEQFIDEELVPKLPVEHGEFSICVVPEHESWTTVFTIRDRQVKVDKLVGRAP